VIQILVNQLNLAYAAIQITAGVGLSKKSFSSPSSLSSTVVSVPFTAASRLSPKLWSIGNASEMSGTSA
jgi:hypothetical protein